MFEGMAQGGIGANWGDGHATDASLLARLSSTADPNPFYQQLVNALYANNAIMSTHVYGCLLPNLPKLFVPSCVYKSDAVPRMDDFCTIPVAPFRTPWAHFSHSVL